MEWRCSYQPHKITEAEVKEDLALNYIQALGPNKQGFPVFLYKASRYNPKVLSAQRVHIQIISLNFQFGRVCFFIFEREIARMNWNKVDAFVAIMDLKGFGLSNWDWKLRTEIIRPMATFYPGSIFQSIDSSSNRYPRKGYLHQHSLDIRRDLEGFSDPFLISTR
jgi:hypothetical protein